MKKLHVSWEQYHRLIEQLAAQVYDSGWTFDALVCLARGGMRVGDVLSRVFDRPLGVLFTSSYRESGGTCQSRLLIAEHMSSASPLPGSRWLLVDDLVDSGATLIEGIPEILRRYPQVKELRSGVLWRKGCSVAVPDYYCQYLPDNPWIVQPFEIYDQMGPEDLAPRLRVH